MAPQHKGGSWSHWVYGFDDQRQNHVYPKYLPRLNQENHNPGKELSRRQIGWVEIRCYRQRRRRKPQGPVQVLRVRMLPKSPAGTVFEVQREGDLEWGIGVHPRELLRRILLWRWIHREFSQSLHPIRKERSFSRTELDVGDEPDRKDQGWRPGRNYRSHPSSTGGEDFLPS